MFADLAFTTTAASAERAKVGIIASGLMEEVQASSAANVATTGLFTIPLMNSLGFEAHFAVPVEAVASIGGQFLPSVVAGPAFIMAQYLGPPYAYVAPGALVYYGAVFLQVYLRARETGMRGIERTRSPAVGPMLLRKRHLLLPILILVGMIVIGYTALYSALFSIISIFVVSSLRQETRMGFWDIVDGLRIAARGMVQTSVACAVIGFVVGSVVFSGLAMPITQQVVRAGAGLLLPTLAIAAISSLVPSFGLPTTSAYIITATLIAPGLIEVSLPPLSAHLFAYYRGGVSAITPPVALAVFVGCGIAGSQLMKTGFTALRLGIASYMVPFYFAFWPMLIIRDAPIIQIIVPIVGAALTVECLPGIGEGGFYRPEGRIKYALLFLSASLMITPTYYSQIAGAVILLYVALGEYTTPRYSKRAEHHAGFTPA